MAPRLTASLILRCKRQSLALRGSLRSHLRMRGLARASKGGGSGGARSRPRVLSSHRAPPARHPWWPRVLRFMPCRRSTCALGRRRLSSAHARPSRASGTGVSASSFDGPRSCASRRAGAQRAPWAVEQRAVGGPLIASLVCGRQTARPMGLRWPSAPRQSGGLPLTAVPKRCGTFICRAAWPPRRISAAPGRLPVQTAPAGHR